MKTNKIIDCKVVGIQDYGMFVECGEYSGLVHISEISDQFVSNIENIFQVGDDVSLQVLEICEDNRLKLSYKKNHQINNRILKSVSMKIGFHSLNNKLSEWIDEKKKEEGQNEED